MKSLKIFRKFSLNRFTNYLSSYYGTKCKKLIFASTMIGMSYMSYKNKFTNMSQELYEKELCDVDSMEDGQMKKVQVGPDEKKDLVLLAKVDGKYYVVGNKCSHFAAPMDKGLLFGDRVYCPYHLASFSVITGMPDFGPVFKGLPVYEVSVRDGKVYAKVPKTVEI